MKAVKTYLIIALMAVAVVSFVVTVWGFILHPAVYGFVAMWVCALSFSLIIFLGIPNDERKSADLHLGL